MQNLDRELLKNRLGAMKAKTGITYRQLSEKTGIAQSTIGAYMVGRRVPELENAFLLAQVLGVSMNWLCGMDKLKGVQE